MQEDMYTWRLPESVSAHLKLAATFSPRDFGPVGAAFSKDGPDALDDQSRLVLDSCGHKCVVQEWGLLRSPMIDRPLWFQPRGWSSEHRGTVYQGFYAGLAISCSRFGRGKGPLLPKLWTVF